MSNHQTTLTLPRTDTSAVRSRIAALRDAATGRPTRITAPALDLADTAEALLASLPDADIPSWTLTIPAPAKWLNANDRYKRRPDKQIRAWRDAAHLYARNARLPRLQRAHIVAELRWCDRTRRDEHNFYPTIKAVIDGLVDYGLLPDDSHRFLIGPDLRHGPVVPRPVLGVGGEVALKIWAVAA